MLDSRRLETRWGLAENECGLIRWVGDPTDVCAVTVRRELAELAEPLAEASSEKRRTLTMRTNLVNMGGFRKLSSLSSMLICIASVNFKRSWLAQQVLRIFYSTSAGSVFLDRHKASSVWLMYKNLLFFTLRGFSRTKDKRR